MKYFNPSILRITVLIACMAGFKIADATITVDSVHVTTSTCPNNGTAKVYARSTRNNAQFLFNLVSGPVNYPQQNDSTFYSLYPGNYSGWVHDANSFDSTRFTFTISGNYQSPVVSVSGSSPLCLNSNTGQIIGHLQPGTGLGPYLWQMYSPYTGPEQQSDTFNNLGTGSFIIRLTDACTVSRSVSIALDTGGTGLEIIPYSTNNTNYIGCGTVVFFGVFSIYISKAYLPLTLTETTSTGTVTKQIYPLVNDTTNAIPPEFYFMDTITGVEFGGPFTVSLSDICDTTITYQPTTFQPFGFNFQLLSDSCGGYVGTISARDSMDLYGALAIDDLLPLYVTVQNAQTLQLVDSYTAVYRFNFDFPCNSCPLFQSQPSNENFILKVTDGCGDSSSSIFNWPQSIVPYCYTGASRFSCRDSTGTEEFILSGFGSTINITILSGPPVAESSSTLFGYQTQMIYPVTLNGLANTGSPVTISNLPPGFYHFIVSDSCGHSITDTFSMDSVVSLYINAPVNSNCNGTSNIEITLAADEDYLYVYSLPNYDTAYISIFNDQDLLVYNREPGTYALSVGFLPEYGPFIPGNPGCSNAVETLVVPNYNDSIIESTYTAYCNGDIYLIVVADTNNGPPPFQYEVLSGPQTFGLQSTGLFHVNAFGTYLVGALDSCGNEDTRYVTADTGRILPAVRSGGLCSGGTVRLNETASPYFSYKWVTPGGHVYNGSSIVINPFTTADTGLVRITQYVTVNGCTDSATGTYYLAFRDTFYNTVYMCGNDTLWVGSSYYTQAGVYTTNLKGVYGCDSVVVSTLHMLPAIHATITALGSDSCNAGPVQLSGGGGTFYRWQPNNLSEQTITVEPGFETTYYLTVSDTGTCYATDSIVLYAFPFVVLTQDTAYVCNKTPAQLCAAVPGVNYLWSNGSTTQCISTLTPGLYNVTITNSLGCTAESEEGQIIANTPPVVQKINDSLVCTSPNLEIYSTYQWTLNGNPIPGATNEVYVPHQSGTYTCVATDSTGCTTPGNNVSFITTGITQLQALANVWLQPNPTTGNIIISTQNFTPKTVTIYDDAGRLISILPFKNEIDISTLSSGVYFMEVSGSEGVVRKRVVKM